MICDFTVWFESLEDNAAGTPKSLTLMIVKEGVGTVQIKFEKGPELDALYRALRQLDQKSFRSKITNALP